MAAAGQAEGLRPAYAWTALGFALLGLVVLFMTSNRGGFVGYTLGIFYMAVLLRRDLGTRTVAMGALSVASLFILAGDHDGFIFLGAAMATTAIGTLIPATVTPAPVS